MIEGTHICSLQRILLSLIVFLCTVVLYTQNPRQLPFLKPTYTHLFNNGDGRHCFDDILMDNTGRLWLIPCKDSRVLNSAALQYYDGYQLHHYELKADQEIVTGNVRLEGISNNGLLYGRIDNKIFLSDFNHDTTKLYTLPPSDNGFNQVARITESSQGNYYILLKSTNVDSLQLWSLRNGAYSFLAQISNPVPSRYRYGLPLIATSGHIWLMGEKLPMHRITLNKNTGFIDEQFRFDKLVTSNLQQESLQKIPKLVSRKNEDLFLYLPTGQNHYFLYFDKNLSQWRNILNQIPDRWQPENICKDLKGNICLLFRNKQGDNTAILRDTSGKLWNFTPMVQGKGQIKGMTSPDFFQKTFLVSDKGIYSMEIDPVEGIDTILSKNWIASMTEIQGGKILINTIDAGWKQYDPSSGRTSTFKGPEDTINPNPFDQGMKQQIIKDHTGNLWMLSGKHLIQYDPNSNQIKDFSIGHKFGLFELLDQDLVALARQNHQIEFYNIKKQRMEYPFPGFSGTLHGRIRDVCYTDQRYLWIPTNRGLYKMDFQKKTTKVLGLDQSFGDVRFTSAWDAPNGKLWLGTYTNGVVILDKNTEEKTFVNTSHGLSNNAVMGMMEDLSGDVWVSTENGISVLSPAGEVLGEIHEQDGLSVKVFERFDPFRNREGLMFFGSSKGVNIIDPVKVKKQFRKPGFVKLYLTHISYYNSKEKKLISKTSGFGNLHPLEIPAGRRNIEMHYALSGNINPTENHFAYKLEGHNKDWTYIGNQRRLDFDFLPAGEYHLILRGSNHKHQWSKNTITIPLQVHDYIYNQTWFYLILLGFLAMIAFIWIRYLQLQRQHLRSEVERRTRQISLDRDTIERQAHDLKKLDELKTSFFSNISHELRTPITLIKTPLEHILNASSGHLKEKVRHSLLTVQNNADRLLSLINGYVELSKLELGEKKVFRTKVDIHVLIHNIVRSFQMTAQTKDIHLDISLSDGIPPLILIDQERLTIILNNLLNNALKYTGNGDQISMSVSVKQKVNGKMTGDRPDIGFQRGLIVKVMDTGIGIPEEYISKIFDRYYRVPGHSNTQSGSGIGLALVKELTEMMGGVVNVESQIGQGSTFTVSIPTAIVPVETSRMSELSQLSYNEPGLNHQTSLDSPENNNSEKILLVEDDSEVRQLICSILGDTYRVITTGQGKEALDWLNEHDEDRISLIIADLMMPVMDGMSLLQEIKKNEKWRKFPFLMLTAKVTRESKLKALQLGVDDYLHKPFSPVELKIRTRNLTEKFQKRMSLENEAERFKGIKFEGAENAAEIWLSRVEETIKYGIENGRECSVGFLAKEMNLSDRQMNRRLKSLTGLSAGHYIREVKLYKARLLLENKAHDTVAEVAYACGFNTPKYFSRLYFDRFGKYPGKYLK